MTTPVQHCIITGAYMPIIKRTIDNHESHLAFVDNYQKMYERFGVTRDEMMVLMPAVMSVDVLAGMDVLRYVGEEKA